MKVTVLEFEEDPTTLLVVDSRRRCRRDNHADANNKGSLSLPTTTPATPLCEYVIEFDAETTTTSSSSSSASGGGTGGTGNNNNNNRHNKVSIEKVTAACRRHSRGEGTTTASSFVFSPILRVIRRLFLPVGYPRSVDSTYLPYQLYDGLQGLCSYWRGVVSTKAVLQATGVGDSDATALSAALNWAFRDGTGMVGGLLYSYVASPTFDSHPKEFRLFLADVMNDIALTLDMVAPYFMGGSTNGAIVVLTLSTLCKTVCGITAGATKGQITHHFARKHGNMADLTAKESTQETLVSLVGMVGGVYVAKILDKLSGNNAFFWTWLMFGVLTLLHVWANYRAVTLLRLSTLNPERTRVIFRKEAVPVMAQQVRLVMMASSSSASASAARSSPSACCPEELVTAAARRNIASPETVQESMVSSLWNLLFPTIQVNRHFDDLKRLRDCTLYMSDLQPQLPYVIGYGGSGKTLYVWLTVGATMEDELQAYVHALLLQELLSGDNNKKTLEFSSSLCQSSLTQIRHLFGNNNNSSFVVPSSRTAAEDNNNGDDSATKPGWSDAAAAADVTLMERLKEVGWDLESRLYLGFSSRRVQVSVKDD